MECRLRLVLGAAEYRLALELLTEAAVNRGHLTDVSVNQYRDFYSIATETEDEPANIEDVLRLLEHDGYLEREDAGYRYLSGMLEDWWLARHGRYFVPIQKRRT